MAWEARSGLKPQHWQLVKMAPPWLNGLGSPFGIETLWLSQVETLIR